jgi:hypothetical protein
MSDFSASGQSCTGMKINADAGTSPVPECSDTWTEKQNAGMQKASAMMPMPSYVLYPLTHNPVAMFAPVEEKFSRDRLEHRRLVALHLVPYIDKKHVQIFFYEKLCYFFLGIYVMKFFSKILPA